MKTKCPRCKQIYEVSPECLGKLLECQCGKTFTAWSVDGPIELRTKKSDVVKNVIGCFLLVIIAWFFMHYVLPQGNPSASTTRLKVSESATEKPRTAVSNQWGRVATQCVGFKQENDIKKYIDIIMSKDFSAADRFSAQLKWSNNAETFSEGTEVFVEKISMFNGASLVRRRGDTQSWWVVMDAVKKKD